MRKITPVFENVTKRDGKTEKFNAEKIKSAIYKAGLAAAEFDEQASLKLTFKAVNILQQIFKKNNPSVEEIQDVVEEVLLTSPYKASAKAYILYREQHSKIRDIVSNFNVDLIDQYLSKKDWQVNENSNMSYSLQGLNNYISSEISKIYWLNKIYTPQIKNAHSDGDLHIHDLGILGVYCVGWDLYDLLLTGFKGVSGKVESVPARHFRTALGQIVNFFYTLQGEAAGAQAFSSFDTLLAPFIAYDKLRYKDVKQALQEFLFNLNVPTRVGFQSPFTNLTFDVKVPKHYADENVVIGGKILDSKYKDFQNEMNMLNEAFLEVMLEGDAKGRVFTFPIPTYNIGKNFDWDNHSLKLLWEITAKYGIPYFANFINSEMDPDDARSMCCRLRIDNRELRRRGGGLFGASPLTGSIGVVTLNMPRLGFTSKNEKDFFDKLEKLMDLSKESLELKRKILEKLTAQNLYPYMSYYLRNVKERFNCFWKNHFSTIGIVGMNECCLNFLKKNIASREGKDFSTKVLNFMREKLEKYQQETGNIYNLEATPAEGTSYRLAKIDKKKYPAIVFANMEAVKQNRPPFYTNSTQLPVNYTNDLFEVLELQHEIQALYTGGTVQHMFVGERITDTSALKEFIKKAFTNYKLPYMSITPTFSVCPSCGYQNGEVKTCPTCGQTCEVYSRVVGYLRPVSQWNEGKQEEYKIRKAVNI
ncbi:MAG: ribonucleoside triphosphate reductase [Endomicrobiaceae bacterium]|nr:ribonucleoside triphosphate reductase [Endomicrobiaceae bacterium]